MAKKIVKNVVPEKSLTKPLEGLCFRCEWRAFFMESGHGPRHECQQVDKCVHSCYMYGPVRPVVLQKDKGDKRDIFAGALFSARSHFVKKGDCVLRVQRLKDGAMPYWAPKAKKMVRVVKLNLTEKEKKTIRDWKDDPTCRVIFNKDKNIKRKTK